VISLSQRPLPTQHTNKHKRLTSMLSAGFEPAIPSNEAVADLRLIPHGHLYSLTIFRHSRKIAKIDYQIRLVCPSVCTLIHMEQLGSHVKDFPDVLYSKIFQKNCTEYSSFIDTLGTGFKRPFPGFLIILTL